MGTFMLLAALLSAPAWSQEQDFRVYGETPRLFLQPRRLLLLERERDRQSMRWQQFRQLVEGKAQWPEPGLAMALYGRISGEEAACREAVRWARTPGAGLRQTAVVFDWCRAVLTQEDSAALVSALERGIAAPRQTAVSEVRDRVLAAVAIADHKPDAAERELRFTVRDWWRGRIVPAMERGEDALPADEALALFEILHVIRDNLHLDLRSPLEDFFLGLPRSRLLGYYPEPYRAAENAYYLPAPGPVDRPDLRRAALARAADLCQVAFDAGSLGSQFLQGWLIRDTLLMRSPLGIVYELLWANPYLPGLSHHHSPPFFHDQRLGRLFVRSSWEEDAVWLSFADGRLRVFEQGGLRGAVLPAAPKPLRLGDVAVVAAQTAGGEITIPGLGARQVFLIGLRPGRSYEVKADEDKPARKTADPAGILGVALKQAGAVKIREIRQ